jgi:hypothetical protein
MRYWTIITGLAVILAALPGWALAAAISSHEVKDDEKTIHFTFKLNQEVKPEAEFFFDANFYALHLPGVTLTRQQEKAGQIEAPKSLQPFYKYIRLVQGEGEAQIRIYLTKLCSPADPQLMGWDKGVIKIDLLKPLFKIEGGAAAALAQPAANSTQPGFIPDGQPGQSPAATDKPEAKVEPAAAPGGTAPAEPAGPAASEPAPDNGGTLRTGNPAAIASKAEEAVAPNPTQPEPPSAAAQQASGTAEEYAATPAGEVIPGNAAPNKYNRQEPGAPQAQPAPGAFSSGPSYKQFDLASVKANGVEIRALPFRQAILELVAGCGFNVVVADTVDNTEVNLNFTQKELSLKSALDLLCIAYDLAYEVQDDAIVIKTK